MRKVFVEPHTFINEFGWYTGRRRKLLKKILKNLTTCMSNFCQIQLLLLIISLVPLRYTVNQFLSISFDNIEKITPTLTKTTQECIELLLYLQ